MSPKEAALIPTPILTVLSTFRKNGVQTLLMGGQACVFYGTAQVSKDIDLALLAEPANIERLHQEAKCNYSIRAFNKLSDHEIV